MKKKLISCLFLALPFLALSQNLRPYLIGAETTGAVKAVAQKAKQALQAQGIEVVGEYQPMEDPNRWLLAVSSNDLKNAVRKVGGLRGFALALRVAVTREGDKTIVSYTNPEYWGRAYFQKDYPSVQSHYAALNRKLSAALHPLGAKGGTPFGSAKGLSPEKLQKYHYMIGMPYFQDNITLNTFDSYSQAVSTIDQNLSKGVPNLVKVYSVELKDKQLKLYGIGLRGETGESHFMPKIDIANPKHTAFLPYEMLVYKNKAYMLHGRFRIALSFPDLSMGTFMKIVSTPGDIKDLLQSATR